MDEPDKLTEEEIARRRDEALLRALSTPHKKQSEMKLGKQRDAKPPKKPTIGRASKK